MYAAASKRLNVCVCLSTPNLEKNLAVPQKNVFGQSGSKIIPITPIKSFSGVAAPFKRNQIL